jgi:predicted HTH domain antitoxin
MSQLDCVKLELSVESVQSGEDAILREIALQLYSQNLFTFGQARRLANLPVWEFQKILAQRNISRHYNESDLLEDIATIAKI